MPSRHTSGIGAIERPVFRVRPLRSSAIGGLRLGSCSPAAYCESRGGLSHLRSHVPLRRAVSPTRHACHSLNRLCDPAGTSTRGNPGELASEVGVMAIPAGDRMLRQRTYKESATRRSFVSRASSVIAAFGLFSGVPGAAEAQLVWKTSDWKLADFRGLVNDPARIKQLFDVVQIGDGKFLGNVKNSLNSLRFGFGVPEQQIKIVAGLHC